MLYDMKNFKAREERDTPTGRLTSIVMIVVMVAVLGWMGEKDQQAKIEQFTAAAQNVCGGM